MSRLNDYSISIVILFFIGGQFSVFYCKYLPVVKDKIAVLVNRDRVGNNSCWISPDIIAVISTVLISRHILDMFCLWCSLTVTGAISIVNSAFYHIGIKISKNDTLCIVRFHIGVKSSGRTAVIISIVTWSPLLIRNYPIRPTNISVFCLLRICSYQIFYIR